MSILRAAADVLKCFSTERPELTVTDVVALRGSPKSSTSRLLRAMRDAGLLETVGASKRYRPGALLYGVGKLSVSSTSLLGRADEVVARVVEEVGHSGYVSVLDGPEVIGVTYHPGRHVLRVATSIGRRLVAPASATGRSLLARFPDDEVRARFRDGFPVPSPTAPQDMDDLLRRLADVRARGYAESNDESNRGVGALAVAVGDPRSGEAVSLCITYPAATITAAERDTVLAGLLGGARAITDLMGDTLCPVPTPARSAPQECIA